MDFSNAERYRRIVIVEGVKSFKDAFAKAGHDTVAQADLVVCIDGPRTRVTKDRYGGVPRDLPPDQVFDLRQLSTTEIVR